jgi:hypothetical protein
MIKRIPTLIGGAALFIGNGAAIAAPFGSFDARSAGMGNTGVASATIANAPFFNPALLSFQKPKDNFALLFTLGVRAADPAGLIDDIKAFQSAYDSFKASPNPSSLAAGDAALTSANGKAALVDVNTAVSLGFSGTDWGGALLLNGYSLNGITVKKGTDDFTNPTPTDPSTLNVMGLQVVEIGASLARGFGPEDSRFAVGVTPKYMKIKTNDYQKPLADVSTDAKDIIDNPANHTEATTVNADVGIIYGDPLGWRTGLAVRNLASKDYVTVNGRTISLEPQPRAGVAYSNNWVTLAVDMDLKENKPVSFDQKTRMLAVGTELNVLNVLQLRLGWQRNLADVGAVKALDLYSVGVGFAVFGAHADAAVVGNNNSLGAVIEFGFRF